MTRAYHPCVCHCVRGAWGRCDSCNRYSGVTCRLTNQLTKFHNGLVVLEAHRAVRNAELNRDPADMLSRPFRIPLSPR